MTNLKTAKKPRSRIADAREDRILYAVNYIFITILALSVLYPLIYILSSSFSSGQAVSSGKVVFLPVDFTLEGYKRVFANPRVYIGYRNTIFYTFFGTINNVMMTLICAYPLARRGLPGRKYLMLLFLFTQYFSGGMIPTYLLLRKLGYINTIWVMIMPGAFGIGQMIVTRTFIQSTIPDELLEATAIDGCSDFRYFWQFVLPLSKAVIAVMTLQYAVGHWNSYFGAFIYISNKKLYPLQVFLREILVLNQIEGEDLYSPQERQIMKGIADLLKYSLIVVSTAPILMIYPFLQKYFTKGIMLGSLKG